MLQLPYVRPLDRGRDSGLLQNYFAFEYQQLTRFVDWKRRLARSASGSSAPRPPTLIVRSAKAQSRLRRLHSGYVPFIGYPLSGRPVESGPLLFAEDNLPREDSAVVVEAATVLRVPVADPPTTEAELALQVEAWRKGDLATFLGPRPPIAEFREAIPTLLDEFAPSRSTVESVILALAGASPIPGEGAGLDVTLGTPGGSPSVSADAGRAISPLLPPWGTSPFRDSSRTLWGGDPRRYPVFHPYGIRVDRFEGDNSALGHPTGADTSAILVGSEAGKRLIQMLLAGDHPVLRSRDDIVAVASSRARLEAFPDAISLLTYAHTIDVIVPQESEITAAVKEGINVIAEAGRMFAEAASVSIVGVEGSFRSAPQVRTSLLRAATARARLDLRSTAVPADFRAVAGSFADSVAAITSSGSARELRPYLIELSFERSARDRERWIALESTILGTPGIQPQDLWEVLKRRGLWPSDTHLAATLDILARRGQIIYRRDGGLVWLE